MSPTYDVFARKQHPDPLTYVGSIEVSAEAELTEAGLAAFGPEDDWLEMVAVPRQAVHVVFDKEEAEPRSSSDE